MERAVRADGRVVEEHVEATEPGDGRIGGRAGLSGVADVRADEQRLPAGGGDDAGDLGALRLIQVDDRDTRPFLREQNRRGAAHALGCPGDKGHLPLQPRPHFHAP